MNPSATRLISTLVGWLVLFHRRRSPPFTGVKHMPERVLKSLRSLRTFMMHNSRNHFLFHVLLYILGGGGGFIYFFIGAGQDGADQSSSSDCVTVIFDVIELVDFPVSQ